MLTNPMDVLSAFPVRKSGKQKQAFRDAVQSYATTLGYEPRVEKGSFGAKNLVIGDPAKANYLVTAHYDTCARLPFPNLITPCSFWGFLGYQLLITAVLFAVPLGIGIVAGFLSGEKETGTIIGYLFLWVELILMMVGPANKHNANDNTSGVVTVLEIARTMPENLRDRVCFVLFDLEEAGLIGSSSYRSAHKKETNRQVVLNLDCVGDGDHILLIPTKKLKKDTAKLAPIYKCCGYFGPKSVLVRDKGFSVYPSDQANFPYGVGIAAFHKGKFGLYLSRIHTPKDTVLEETNVNILRAAITTLICGKEQP